MSAPHSDYGIGKRLADLRALLGLTRAEVAAGTGTEFERPMDASIISRYEKGKTIPGWRAIERILSAMGQHPCALFDDFCDPSSAEEKFRVAYFDHRPPDPNHIKPTRVLQLGKLSALWPVVGISPVDDRYVLMRAVDDAMIPSWYPGDIVVIDRKKDASPGRIVVGFLDGEPYARRLVRHNKKLSLHASNQTYPPVRFFKSKWTHGGVVIYSLRDLVSRYAGTVVEP